MNGDFRLYHEIRGLDLEDIRDPEWIEHIKREEEIRRKGLEALERGEEGYGWGLSKPYFRCYSYAEEPKREYAFESFDDVMAFAQLLCISCSDGTQPNGLVEVQHIPSYAVGLAYVDVPRNRSNRYALPKFFMAADGMACTKPVTLDTIRGIVDGTVADSARLRERRYEREKQRREKLPKLAMGREILLPGLPDQWYEWPIAIDLNIALQPWQCVYRELFWKYEARTMLDALRKLSAGRYGEIGLQYDFRAWEFETNFNWYVDWPARRRGKEDAIYRRPGTGNIVPLDGRTVRDDTIFMAYLQPSGRMYQNPVFRLRVGGKTRKETVENWMQARKVIRRYV